MKMQHFFIILLQKKLFLFAIHTIIAAKGKKIIAKSHKRHNFFTLKWLKIKSIFVSLPRLIVN